MDYFAIKKRISTITGENLLNILWSYWGLIYPFDLLSKIHTSSCVMFECMFLWMGEENDNNFSFIVFAYNERQDI